jgi:hypothetical protein
MYSTALDDQHPVLITQVGKRIVETLSLSLGVVQDTLRGIEPESEPGHELPLGLLSRAESSRPSRTCEAGLGLCFQAVLNFINIYECVIGSIEEVTR